ncbi:streptophobe family protein [Streptomyces sp. NPDC019443]|uniref:streptophobe family protein n=1 Tax=Streptomyces sp. NPDC019443 TaxID=3365061 RepID=UPI0037B0F70D
MDASGSGDKVPWGDVVLASIAAVSWALVGMAGAAALGLHLLGADSAGSLGPMTAAAVVLAVGGSVTPAGDVSAFGLEGAQARTAVDITPLGVGLVGALFLAYFFLRSLRRAGPYISGTELAARAGGVATLFVAMVGGLAWAGHDVITIDGAKLGLDLDKVPGLGGDGGGIEVPGLGDIGGLLPDRLGDLVDAQASVGFSVNTADSLAGALFWVLGVLVISLLASRRAPLPRGAVWQALRRVVRPAASAVVTVLLVAVLAGYAAAAYAAIGDDHPKRIAGAALLGAPNGVWLGVPLGLFVPWDGEANGELAKLLPDPLDELLRVSADEPVTVGRLAELDGRVWLLAVATAVMMLYAGVLAAARTPAGGLTAAGFAGRCAVRLGVVTALALPLLVWLTDVSADASLSVLGFDAFGAGIELHGQVGMALLLGAAWGAAAGGVGALLVYGTRGGGRGAAAGPTAEWAAEAAAPTAAELPGPYRPVPPYRPSNDATNPYLRPPPEIHGAPTVAGPMPPMPPPPPSPYRASPPPPEEGTPPPPGTPGGRR